MRHAVSWQSTLLGLTADYAVLKINFADVCILCSPLIYFSLVYMHVRIPVCAWCTHTNVLLLLLWLCIYGSCYIWVWLLSFWFVPIDSTIHSNTPRTSGTHTPWTYREKQPGLCQIEAGGAFQVLLHNFNETYARLRQEIWLSVMVV